MKRVGQLVAKDNSLKLDIFRENDIEFVQIGMNILELKFINLKEFERWEEITNVR